jgi:hypothetical protein
LVWMMVYVERLYSMLHALHQIGFEVESFDIYGDTSVFLRTDVGFPKTKCGHLLVGMDTFDDRGGAHTFDDFHSLARHALQVGGLASHCFGSTTQTGTPIFNLIHTLQTREPSASDDNQDVRPQSLIPSGHCLLMHHQGGSIALTITTCKRAVQSCIPRDPWKIACAAAAIAGLCALWKLGGKLKR